MPRVKHYFEKGHVFHITTRTKGQVHAFATDASKRIVIASLSFYRQRGDWRLFGFVIMGNHVHLVAQQTSVGLSSVVGNFKKWVWTRLAPADHDNLWERRFDDNAITHPRELQDVIQYVHNNPVRAGIVGRQEDYFWSSARNYADLEPVAMEIDRVEGPL